MQDDSYFPLEAWHGVIWQRIIIGTEMSNSHFIIYLLDSAAASIFQKYVSKIHIDQVLKILNFMPWKIKALKLPRLTLELDVCFCLLCLHSVKYGT